ncbi:MAG: hypothetical protein NTX61_01915 [Bacteroidetes bacterium]|nr:hypothetical protein [Bacteroidota bacterium]
MEEQNTKPGRSKLIIILLIFAMGALFIWVFIQRSHLTTLVKEKEMERYQLQKELDSMVTEHNKIKQAYGSLSDSLKKKDSIIQSNAKEIKKLLDTEWEYNKIRKKFEMLQVIAQGYVHQMDSLYTLTRELREENEKISQDFKNEQSKNKTLVKDKEVLSEKMNEAAVLKAYGVTITPMKLKGGQKEQPTDKASRTDRLKICFTIGENPLIKTATKIIYIRIIRPDNVVVTKTKYDTFTYHGQTAPYSIREDIDFKGTSINICVNWTKKDTDKAAMKGKYSVIIISEDKEIGQGTFELK